jgi:hypothetical protein
MSDLFYSKFVYFTPPPPRSKAKPVPIAKIAGSLRLKAISGAVRTLSRRQAKKFTRRLAKVLRKYPNFKHQDIGKLLKKLKIDFKNSKYLGKYFLRSRSEKIQSFVAYFMSHMGTATISKLFRVKVKTRPSPNLTRRDVKRIKRIVRKRPGFTAHLTQILAKLNIDVSKEIRLQKALMKTKKISLLAYVAKTTVTQSILIKLAKIGKFRRSEKCLRAYFSNKNLIFGIIRTLAKNGGGKLQLYLVKNPLPHIGAKKQAFIFVQLAIYGTFKVKKLAVQRPELKDENEFRTIISATKGTRRNLQIFRLLAKHPSITDSLGGDMWNKYRPVGQKLSRKLRYVLNKDFQFSYNLSGNQNLSGNFLQKTIKYLNARKISRRNIIKICVNIANHKNITQGLVYQMWTKFSYTKTNPTINSTLVANKKTPSPIIKQIAIKAPNRSKIHLAILKRHPLDPAVRKISQRKRPV